MNSRYRTGQAGAAVFAVVASFAGVVSGKGQAPPVQVPPGPASPAQVPPGQPPPGPFPPGQAPQGSSRRGGYPRPTPRVPTGPAIKLPTPKAKGDVSVEQALWGRRTLRSATAGQITLEDAGQLLWAAQGVTGQWGRRAAPSAGGAYALEVLLVAGDVAGLPAGVYRYYGASNQLERLAEGDKRASLAQLTKFEGIEHAPAIVVITAVESRALRVFPSEAVAHQHVAVEAGAATQNLMLEAVALGLGSAEVSDSDDAKLAQVLGLPSEEKPVAITVISRS